MHLFKNRIGLFLVLTAVLFTFLLASCQKEEMNLKKESTQQLDIEPGKFQKEFTLTDSTGKNSVTLRMSSESPFEDNFDAAQEISVKPIFEAPEENSKAEAVPFEKDFANQPIVTVEVVSQKLEEGAIGLKLDFKADNSGEAEARAIYTYAFYTYYDHIGVTAWTGCLTAHYLHRPYSYSPWIWFNSFFLCGVNWSFGYSIYSYQMGTVVYYYSGTWFTVYVW